MTKCDYVNALSPGEKRCLEKDIQSDVVKLLKTVGAAVYKIGTTRKRGDHQGTMQTAGIPDLVAFVPLPLGSIYARYSLGATLDRSEEARRQDERGAVSVPPAREGGWL